MKARGTFNIRRDKIVFWLSLIVRLGQFSLLLFETCEWLLRPPLHSCLLHIYMKGTCFFFSHFLLNYWVVSYQTNQVPPMPGFFVGFNIKHTHHKRWPSFWVLCCHQCKGLFGMYCVLPNTKKEQYLVNKPSILASRYNSRILTFSGLKLEKLKGSLGKSSLVQICRLHFLQSLNWNDVLKINAFTYLSNLSTISYLSQISFPYYCKDCKLAST